MRSTRGALGAAGLAALAALAGAAACGRIRPLAGGAADVEPPRFLGSDPPDSSVGLPLLPKIELRFDEKLQPSSVQQGLRFYPAIRRDEIEVRGSEVVVTFAESLPPDTTLVVVLGRTIQDLPGRNNKLPEETWLVFSTGQLLKSASVLGRVSTLGKPEPNGAVAYEPARAESAAGGRPGSRVRYPAAAVDAQGRFRLCGLPPGKPFVLRAFVDRNQNLTADPDELSQALPETLLLAVGEVRRGVEWNLVDPSEPGRVHGVAINLTRLEGPVAVALQVSTRADSAADTLAARAGASATASPPPGALAKGDTARPDSVGRNVRADTLRPLPLPIPARAASSWGEAYAALEPRGFVPSEWVVVYASARGDYSVRVPPGQHRLLAFVDASRDSVPGAYVLSDSTRLDWEPLWVGGVLEVGPGEDLRPRGIEIAVPP